jgi:hypothetical protein
MLRKAYWLARRDPLRKEIMEVLPTSRTGWGALLLGSLSALAYTGLSITAAAFGGIEIAWVGFLMGALFLLGGLAAGVLAAIAIFTARERALLVFAVIAPAAVALLFFANELAYIVVLWLTGIPIH